MRKKRYNYTPEEKVFILKRHLVEHIAVSDLCDEYQLQPKVFYEWLRHESRMCDCLAAPSDQTCRPIGSTLRGTATR